MKARPTDGMVELAGGEFLQLAPFWIDACAVSNAGFARFVEETGHVTEAERFGWSFVFGGLHCERYRVAGRNSLTPDSTTGNTGFRCVRDSG